MNATPQARLKHRHPQVLQQTVHWTARIWALLSIALLAAFASSPSEPAWPTLGEWLGLAFFPGAVATGLAVGWRHELVGGLVAIGGLIGFYIWHFAFDGSWPGGPYFALFTTPAAVFLASHFLRARAERLTDSPKAVAN